jgi:hypothetical protein
MARRGRLEVEVHGDNEGGGGAGASTGAAEHVAIGGATLEATVPVWLRFSKVLRTLTVHVRAHCVVVVETLRRRCGRQQGVQG